MKKYAILVAGGQGTRMQGTLPKQFLTISEEPVLAHTLRRFNFQDIKILVVMHSGYLEYWNDLRKTLKNIPEHSVIAGGKTRALSVHAGLSQINEEGLVAVHDAVRPICPEQLIARLFLAAEKEGSAVPVINCKDTLRMLTETGSITVPRDRYKAVQTPQVFSIQKLKAAFQLPGFENFTDEASLYEAAGNRVHLEDGEECNIKITVPSDLLLAESFLKKTG